MSGPADEHRKLAAGQVARCAVLTVSDTRTRETDQGGRLVIDHLERAGHSVKDYEIVRDEPDEIRSRLEKWLAPADLEVVFTTGGTGIARRDTTIEVVRSLLDRELEGFGELFRMLSFDDIGAAAMLSRAVAGLAGETLLFAMPGSSGAVELAMSRLIVPELSHLVWERRK
ncbi:MAG: molybdenum cofactor biosynthesis protein [Phycisphaeraceae bacterium]|nr:molybdenum cofactor biosynthesis protein [Phycisphaeraceae bacterium]